MVSISDVRLEGVAGTRLGTPSRLTSGRTPTPTWTEGTPSYTESSYSGDTGQYHPLPSLCTAAALLFSLPQHAHQEPGHQQGQCAGRQGGGEGLPGDRDGEYGRGLVLHLVL